MRFCSIFLAAASLFAAGGAPASAQKLESFKDCDVCPEMVVLPEGTYWMGATDEDKAFPYVEYEIPAELPRHEVTFDYSFAIGRYTVTVAEFAAFVDETGFEAGGECLLLIPTKGPNKTKFIGEIVANAKEWEQGKYGLALVEYADFRTPGTTVGDRQPATCISRIEAKAYLAWLSERTGRNYRFPTEAEWEYAARAGEAKPFFFGGGHAERDRLCEYANFGDQASVYATADQAACAEKPSLEYATPVGSFKPNAWGLHDMVGNVFEFVEDCYFGDYNGAPADGSPWLHSTAHGELSTEAPGQCKTRVLRGYSYEAADTNLRSAARCEAYSSEEGRSNALGLRVAVSMRGNAWDLE